MLISASEFPSGHVLETDIAIIGAGPAGITLTRRLARVGARVTLLESGGLEPDERVKSLLRGSVTGHPYFALNWTRLRFFGGTSNHWTGWCRPLDDIDFQKREWIADSGWPVDRTELDPYYEVAHEICDLGPVDYDPDRWAQRVSSRLLPLDRTLIEPTLWQFSKPTRFGPKYQSELEASDTITVVLGATVADIVGSTHAPSQVEELRIARFDGEPWTVRPRVVVLAAGGIETARILLASDVGRPGGPANTNGLVGRYFTEHPHSLVGKVLMHGNEDALRLYRSVVDVPGGKPSAVRFGFTLGSEVQRDKGLLGFSATLEPASSPAPGRSLRRGVVALLETLYSEPTRTFDLFVRSEQCPNPDSRIVLTGERDALGVRRIALHWVVEEQAKATIVHGVERIAAAFGKAGLGRVYSHAHTNDPPVPGRWPGIGGGHHHMGTARMAETAEQGVVDRNLRVFGMDNLFVASSAVFPTGGYANPTLTIVALSARLAAHLGENYG